MSFDVKRYEVSHKSLLRDTRPLHRRIGDTFRESSVSISVFVACAVFVWFPPVTPWADVLVVFAALYFWWLRSQDKSLPFKLPYGASYPDKNNEGPGQSGKPEGILYLGNDKKTGEELWLNTNDIKTHIMYLGTTGSGKTVGLQSIASNALVVGIGICLHRREGRYRIYGPTLSSMVRAGLGVMMILFVINYMTGNSGRKGPVQHSEPVFNRICIVPDANSWFRYLPDATGDNVMWKERAVSMISAPLCLCNDVETRPPGYAVESVSTIRHSMILNNIIKLSRDDQVPD
jgi:intracellular multiplication protein IcmO